MPTGSNFLISPKQKQGGYYEQLALAYLQKQGLTLIARNWHQPKVGELDLVMLQIGQAWDTILFIEVRQRKLSGFGNAQTSVTPAKQRKLVKTARHFLAQHPDYADYECRFDVVAFNVTAQAHCLNKEDTRKILTRSEDEHVNKVTEPDWIQGAFITSSWYG